MGFNNEGVEVVAERLRKWREREQGIGNREWRTGNDEQGMKSCSTFNLQPSTFNNPASPGQPPSANRHPALIIGGNIGKNKTTPNELAWQDYETCFRALHPYVDYFVVNVSSPNTPGLRELQDKESLRNILTRLQQLNKEIIQSQSAIDNDVSTFNFQLSTFNLQPAARPIFLKIAPDLTREQLDDVISLALEIQLDGIVATNTTISREGLRTSPAVIDRIGAGGLSGRPVRQRSTEVVRYIHEKTGGRLPIIASGGIFTAADAREKLEAGASLVQVWTGFIYEGPRIVAVICRGLQH
jgi:dihydroorotate dehydrogenase